LLKLGTLDWSVSSFQNLKGNISKFAGIGLGTEFLFGEVNVSANFNDNYKFDYRQLQYQWRWIDNDKSLIKQAQFGRLSTPHISFINSPIIGGTVRNSPTSVRKAKGFYTISDITEPNWTVELYINNVLIEYTTADDSGNFRFKVPIVYGFTQITLKYFGPLGEERIEERTVNMPNSFMPVNEFDFGLSAGIVQDGMGNRFGKADFNYGVSRMLTIGSGVEYLSSLPGSSMIPFANFIFQPFSRLTINGEYAHGIKSRAAFNYSLGKEMTWEVDYTKYVEGQTATPFNAVQEFKTRFSAPIKFQKMNGFFKADYNKFSYINVNYNYLNLLFSAFYNKISASANTQLNWVDYNTPYITNNLVLGYKLSEKLFASTSGRYNVTNNLLMSYKVDLVRVLPKGRLSVSYNRNSLAKNDFFSVNYRYELPYARAGITASLSNSATTITENVQGSMVFDKQSNYVRFGNSSSMSKGGIVFYPFLDLNQNGVFDKNEHLVKINDVKIKGGTVIKREKDTLVHVINLTGFTKHKIVFDDNDLDNIGWKFKNKIYEVLVNPNQFTRINVPVIAVGELNGMTYFDSNGSKEEISRILINIYKKGSNELVAQTLSESDGYIYVFGLKPGEYRASVDPEQLSNLGFISNPPFRDFKIRQLEEGDIVDGIDFVLRAANEEK
jgi:hypothetical protein